MILNILMEENQLDFNQPLLSVRRFSSTVTSQNENKRKTNKSEAKRPPLPTYKSELKSGPVSNPGTVPFEWEKTPGRPKNESKLQTKAIERPYMSPKLPPGRVVKAEQQYFDKVPKGASVTQSRTESSPSDSHSVSSWDDKVRKHESRKEVVQENESSVSDDGDEAYLDALDTLSRSESFFMNCSVSGLSGWDDQEVQPSESFSTDQQARDFMIGRFLPAAKAMVSETPPVQYNSRKPIVKQEQQPRQLRKVVTGANSHPLNPKWQKVLPYYAQDIDKEESEDESGDDDDRSENYSAKICGLFPRFCLLNPIPGLRMNDRILSSTVDRVPGKSFASHGRTSKEHARTANYGKRSVESQSGSTKERDFLSVTENSKHGIDPHRKGFSTPFAREGNQNESSSESPVAEKTLYVDSVQMVKSSSSEMKGPTNQGGDDFDTLTKYSSIVKTPCIDSSIEDSNDLGVVDEKEALHPKSSVSLESLLLVRSDNYTDDMQMKMRNLSNKMDSKKQGLIKPDYQSKLDRNLVVISSPETVKYKKIESENKFSSSEKSSGGLIQNPVSWRNSKEGNDSEFDQQSIRDSNENQPPMKLDNGETSYACSMKLPLALPLPKAPSESWLKRTLPTVSSRNTSSWSNLASNIHVPSQAPKTASLDPKWEIIVKSSNVHRGHLRFAEELTPIPEA